MYFDYSASTPINKKALEAYNKSILEHSANPHSNHSPAKKSLHQIREDIQRFKNSLNLNTHHITFTQNATQANQMIINHTLKTPKTMHVICGPFEHPSVIQALSKLQRQGLKIDVCEIDEEGLIDVDHFKSLIKPETSFICISLVDSELGIIQNIEKLKSFTPHIPFLCDITQAIGKVPIHLNKVDYLTFSAHKFYGPKGLGGIFHLNGLNDRQGTMPTELIHASYVALEETLKSDRNKVVSYKDTLIHAFSKMHHVKINSPDTTVPHVLNISIDTSKTQNLITYFSDQGIYVSRGVACSNSHFSQNIFTLTQSIKHAETSVRISLSHLTTPQEIETFIQVIKELA